MAVSLTIFLTGEFSPILGSPGFEEMDHVFSQLKETIETATRPAQIDDILTDSFSAKDKYI
jgi:hypothetical protein